MTEVNDLLPLGDTIVVFAQHLGAGDLVRTNIPVLRLPVRVLDDDIGMILDRRVELR